MASKIISQRISLEGSDDIRKKLLELGAAGEKAFKQIQDAAAKPIVDSAAVDRTRQAFEQLAQATARLGPQFQQLAADTQTFGSAGAQATQQVTAGLSQTTQAAGQAGSSLTSASVKFGIAAVTIVTAISAILRSLTSGAGETATSITDTAEKLGLTIEQWIGLRRAIDAAGNSSEGFANSVGPLIRVLNALSLEVSGRQVYTFANGMQTTVFAARALSQQSKELVAELEKFGVTLQDLQKGDVTAMLQKMALAIDKLPEGAAKAGAGIKFFGPQWRKAIEDLLVGLKAVGDAESELDNKRRASRELTKDQTKDAKDAADQWEDLGKAIRAVKDQVGAFFAPGSFARAKWLTDMVDDARFLLQTWLKLEEAERKIFLQTIPSGAAATAFKILVALGEQLGGIWRDVLVPAGEKLMGIFDSIAGLLEGITGSQVAAFFITAALAAAGLAIALKAIGLLLTPLSLLLSLFSPFGAVLLAAAAAAFLFWDKIKAGANEAAALIPAELAAIGEAFKKLLAGDFAGFWNQFAAAAVSAFQKISQGPDTNWVTVLINFLKTIPGTIELIVKAFIGLGQAAQGVANIVNRVFGTKLTGTDIAVLTIAELMTGVFQGLAAAIAIVGGLLTPVILGLGALVAAILGIPVAIGAALVALALLVTALLAFNWGAITAGAAAFVEAIGQAATAVANFAAQIAGFAWDAFKSAGVAAWNAITGAIQSAINATLNFLGLRSSAPGGGTPGATTPAPGLAGGGYIRGPGTATSDSILARLSDGEFVVSARAVQHWGVDFLSRLNNLQSPRFSMGGLAQMPQMPRFAEGGLATAGSGAGQTPFFGRIELASADGARVSGLVESQIFDVLKRGAVKRNMGAHPKPGWVR